MLPSRRAQLTGQGWTEGLPCAAVAHGARNNEKISLRPGEAGRGGAGWGGPRLSLQSSVAQWKEDETETFSAIITEARGEGSYLAVTWQLPAWRGGAWRRVAARGVAWQDGAWPGRGAWHANT